MAKRKPSKRRCHDDKRSLTKEAASFEARRLIRKGALVSIYKCPYCKSWHVGKSLKDKGKRIFKLFGMIEQEKSNRKVSRETMEKGED